jgi:SNF family Na+-dependent transporter
MSEKRETLGSRLGFILLSAGCAIGLGNVWRFPYITGQYGGAIFVLIYLMFLLLLGLPIIVMEFAVGRAARASLPVALKNLEPAGTKWHWYGPFSIAGNYILMMFYTVITGWLLAYCYYSICGTFVDFTTAAKTQEFFGAFLSSPKELAFWMVISVLIGFGVCSLGVRKGVIVTIIMPNTPEAVVSIYALNRIGAVANILHPLSAQEEIKSHINGVESRVLLCADVCCDVVGSTVDVALHVGLRCRGA